MVSYISEVCDDSFEEARIMAWYITGIRHETIRIAKKQQYLRRHEALILNKPVDDSEDESAEMIDIVADSGNNISMMEEKIDIEQVLSHLTLKQQRVIRMIFMQEKTEKEVAEKLGISQPAVHSIKNRALKKIREYMEKHMKEYFN